MNLFDAIKTHVNITTVINEYVSIKKAGIYYKGRCPFHQEKDASFTVSPHKQIFYCFGCHATGDVISFIAQIEGCSQLEAAKFIIDKYNIELPPHLLEQKQELAVSIDQKNRYYHLCQTVAQWCIEQFNTNDLAKKYLKERSINKETIERFSIGYFPPGNAALKALHYFIRRHNLLVKDLIDNHIVIDSPKGLYSPFEDRIIFPITDHLGRMCGFGGRIFKPDDTRAKYYNSRENNFFNKGSLLYGLHQAKKSIQTTTHAFLVEGYIDCITMAQHGYQNTIATLGTACSHEHLKLLSHYTETLNVTFDGDAAGLRAMLRLTQLCWHANINIRIICLPKNEDPASFLSAGNTLESYLEQAPDIFTFFIAHASAQFKQQSLRAKLETVRELLAIVSSLDDRLKQVILLQQAADSLQLPYDVLQRECLRNRSTKVSDNKVPTIEMPRATPLEKKLFALIIEQPTLTSRPEVTLLIEVLPQELQRILKQYVQLTTPTLEQLASNLSEEDKQLTYSLVMTQDKTEFSDAAYIIENALRQHWKVLTQRIKEKVAQAQQQNNQQQVTQLLEYLQEVKNKILARSLP